MGTLLLSLSFTGRDREDVITEGNDSSNNCVNSHHWLKLGIHWNSSCIYICIEYWKQKLLWPEIKNELSVEWLGSGGEWWAMGNKRGRQKAAVDWEEATQLSLPIIYHWHSQTHPAASPILHTNYVTRKETKWTPVSNVTKIIIGPFLWIQSLLRVRWNIYI